MSRLIGLTGAIGAGKDTVADILHGKYGYSKFGMAEPIKNMAAAMLGVRKELFEDRHYKEAILPDIGVTPRRLMQTLGTEWGREIINPDLWIILTERRVQHALRCGVDAVVTDVRFPNERDMVLRNGGVVCRVLRGNNPYAPHTTEEHKSDTALTYTDGEVIIINSATLADLEVEVEGLVERLRGTR